MASLSQVECSLKHLMEERANVLARETGCIKRQRKFSGADLLQTLVFGWLSHPDAILEEMTAVVVEADRQVPLELVSRFEAVVLARQQYRRATK
jgi:hypothetical protein